MSFFLSQMRVAAEVKLILSIQPEQRTEQQLAKVFLLHFASNSIVTLSVSSKQVTLNYSSLFARILLTQTESESS